MCKSLIKSPYLDKINNDKFIGWPMFPQLDGYSFGSKLYDLDPDREKYFINSENVHPSKLGQEKITEWLYNESLGRLPATKENWI